MMTIECIHCPVSISYYDPDRADSLLADAHALFHQPCQRCNPTTSGKEALCPTCQHLRLDHLVLCTPMEVRRRFLFHLRPSLTDGATTSDCSLCRLIQHMVLLAFGGRSIPDLMPEDWTISLFLGFELGRSYSMTADIYLQFSVGDEDRSNMWIGDLHIAGLSHNSIPMTCVGAEINWPRLRDAIDRCNTNHTSCQRKDSANLPYGFRLIDIARRRIVQAKDVPFVALSYVWGKDMRPSLLTAYQNTIAGFGKEGGLVALDMPRTIEDAMQICTELKFNYLWADRLCIVQDDPEDKMNQIMAMNDIYESASLVLVSAHGDSMDFGVHGVSRPRSIAQSHEEIAGLRLTNLVREDAENSLDVWKTRGWTYQEAVCANRLLHFTNTRAYYECQISTCYEDPYNAETEVDEFSAYGLRLEDEDEEFEAFARHLANYTSRQLSFASDVYNAFIGIANLLYNGSYNESFFYGLPRVDFDRALRWYAWNGEKPVARAEFSGVTCPTWSWAAAMAQGEQVRYQDTEFYGALTAWNIQSEDSEYWEQLNIRSETRVDGNWQTYMELASQEGCLQTQSSDDVSSSMTLTAQTAHRWPDYLSFCKVALQIPATSRDECSATEKVRPGHIVAVAQIASFRLGQRGSNHYGVGIFSSDSAIAGELCGEITHSREEALAPINREVQYEFVALSLSGLHVRPYTGEERVTKRYHDKDGGLLDKIPIVNVLLIERTGDIAYRKELGWIYLHDWAKAERRLETIVLG